MDLTLAEIAEAVGGGQALLVRLVELTRENAALRAELAKYAPPEEADAQPPSGH